MTKALYFLFLLIIVQDTNAQDITGGDKFRFLSSTVTADTFTFSTKNTGVNVISTQSGQPGASGFIQIRGRTSIHDTSIPLVIIDGIELYGSTINISIEDIQSISILTSANAVSRFGSRSANGVINIMTRRGNHISPLP